PRRFPEQAVVVGDEAFGVLRADQDVIEVHDAPFRYGRRIRSIANIGTYRATGSAGDAGAAVELFASTRGAALTFPDAMGVILRSHGESRRRHVPPPPPYAHRARGGSRSDDRGCPRA